MFSFSTDSSRFLGCVQCCYALCYVHPWDTIDLVSVLDPLNPDCTEVIYFSSPDLDARMTLVRLLAQSINSYILETRQWLTANCE
jgi:hypothetical protein